LPRDVKNRLREKGVDSELWHALLDEQAECMPDVVPDGFHGLMRRAMKRAEELMDSRNKLGLDPRAQLGLPTTPQRPAEVGRLEERPR